MSNRVRAALVGVGNCAAALVQGIYYYRNRPDDAHGLISHRIGKYKVGDIDIVAAFDVDSDKVGRDVSDAIRLGNNNVTQISDVPPLGTVVSASPVLDGLGENYREKILRIESGTKENIIQVLRESKAEVIVNYLPVGSSEATLWWADIAIEARCAFINCIPEFIASDKVIASRFVDACLPLFGDDVKSQFGATLLHRIIVRHLELKGFVIEKTYQLNFGGNMDFYNMLNTDRLASKRVSKREAVRSLQKTPIDLRNVHIEPSDYIEWLEDNKWCYIHVQCLGFGGTPMRLEAKLEVCDSPNSAGVVVDVIRLAKLALNRKIGGPVADVCAFYMKSPPVPMDEDEALSCFKRWLVKNS